MQRTASLLLAAATLVSAQSASATILYTGPGSSFGSRASLSILVEVFEPPTEERADWTASTFASGRLHFTERGVLAPFAEIQSLEFNYPDIDETIFLFPADIPVHVVTSGVSWSTTGDPLAEVPFNESGDLNLVSYSVAGSGYLELFGEVLQFDLSREVVCDTNMNRCPTADRFELMVTNFEQMKLRGPLPFVPCVGSFFDCSYRQTWTLGNGLEASVRIQGLGGPTFVPEPNTALLTATGLAALAARKRYASAKARSTTAVT